MTAVRGFPILGARGYGRSAVPPTARPGRPALVLTLVCAGGRSSGEQDQATPDSALLGLRPVRVHEPEDRLPRPDSRGRPATLLSPAGNLPRPMASIDLTNVTEVSTEPGELPETMAAWVIREEREGEPRDAFQLEEIEVPEPGAFEVIVRVMAAGVNYNNVWAALGQPVGVWRYGDHPEYGHHIGGSDASGIVWKVGEGVTRWKPGDEVVIHCNHGLLRGPRGARPRPDGRAQPDDLGLRDHLGLVRPVHEGPGPAAAAQARSTSPGRRPPPTASSTSPPTGC